MQDEMPSTLARPRRATPVRSRTGRAAVSGRAARTIRLARLVPASALLLVLLLGALLPAARASAHPAAFTIAGASEAYPLVALMARRYAATRPPIAIDVLPTTGSGFDAACSGTAAQIGMSNTYISDVQRSRPGCRDLLNLPIALDALCVIYNLPGAALTQRTADGFTLAHPLHLSRQVLVNIYAGAVSRWDDPALVALNPSLALPAQRIALYDLAEPGSNRPVLDRWLSPPASPGGITTPSEASAPRAAGVVRLPASGAMVQAIGQTSYSLGYVGLNYAIANREQVAALRNASGLFQTPSPTTLRAALNSRLHSGGIALDFRTSLVDVPGHDSYPLTYFEYLLVHRHLGSLPHADLATRAAIKAFLQWSIHPRGGQALVAQLVMAPVVRPTAPGCTNGFCPVPDPIAAALQALIDSIEV